MATEVFKTRNGKVTQMQLLQVCENGRHDNQVLGLPVLNTFIFSASFGVNPSTLAVSLKLQSSSRRLSLPLCFRGFSVDKLLGWIKWSPRRLRCGIGRLHWSYDKPRAAFRTQTYSEDAKILRASSRLEGWAKTVYARCANLLRWTTFRIEFSILSTETR
jgi:hypothetical protein